MKRRCLGATVILRSALLIVALAGCGGEQTYDVRGRIAGFGSDPRTVIVEHGDIPGLMPGMTMPFTAIDSAEVARLHPGDAIAFRLTVARGRSWISDIRRISDDALPEHPAGVADSRSTSSRPVDTGDPVPAISLVTHADTTLTFDDLLGTAVVLTFVYTRCPLPEFCPLLSKRMADLQKLLRESDLGMVRLLSVSFDPEYDTPEVLREYAGRYTHDLSDWTFATGEADSVRAFANRFGVTYRAEEGQITHNLATALVGPDGRIRRLWRGNEWEPEQIAESIRRMRDRRP